ncbi:MAG: PAS domain-containing protein [Oscillibacter sp.]|nr:PAS domain-containing protein [Oscillibacter sp.]
MGLALGPDYEVALHDLTDANRSIIAIANSHISGRKVGAPLTNVALSILRSRSYEHTDYRLHYSGLSVNGKELRSSTFFIKHEGELIGMLCVNFDDSRYREAAERILGLCHPDAFIAPKREEPSAPPPGNPERFASSTEALVKDSVRTELDRLGVTPDRLTAEERLTVIAALEENGIFLIKGAVREVAAELCCSQASVYRYLSQMKNVGFEAR